MAPDRAVSVAGWAAVVVLAAFLSLGLVVVAVVLGSGSHDDDDLHQ